MKEGKVSSVFGTNIPYRLCCNDVIAHKIDCLIRAESFGLFSIVMRRRSPSLIARSTTLKNIVKYLLVNI